ncbi:MAG TPA: oxidoreductase [Chitinophagaceae bacterium]|nr:oxidoreductase [Chitinophagaceae bacterium]HCT21948.1 oxidoreductase [Chitinophagaceae bacterium]
METLKGKRVVVAGATGDIGKGIARMLVQSGAQVVITGRNQDKLVQVAQTIGLGADRYQAADLSKSADIDALHQKAIQALGEVDILVNAAGIGIIKPIEQLSEAEFMQTLQTNLLGAFLLVKAFLPGMKVQKKGLIINIPGVLGKVPMAGAAAYAASKYGLTGMMQSIREELKRTDIRITNLFLGGVDSAFWDTIDLRVQRDKMIVAEEAARAVWFLCQQPASGVVSEMVLQPFNHQAI